MMYARISVTQGGHQDAHNAEADAFVAVIRVAVAAGGGPDETNITGKRPATHDARRPFRRPGRIWIDDLAMFEECIRRGSFGVVVGDPFGHVSVHVVEAPCVGLIGTDLGRSLEVGND